MCNNPKHICIPNPNPTRAYPESFIEVNVPCGKCLPCLKRRQTDYATRLYRECRDGAQMWFVTLTYRNNALPLSITHNTYDTDSGEMIQHFSEVMTEKYYDKDIIEDFRSELLQQKSSPVARYLRFERVVPEELKLVGSYYCTTEVTPSLNREDVRVWLKKRRIQYKRDYGVNLKFRYGFCGEYGPRGCRPHYHIIFLDLNKEQLMFFLDRWKSDFGYVYYKEVPVLNADGTDARQIVAKYVGKYISKGKFDADSVLFGDAQKGRLCNSKRFGTQDFSYEEQRYYKCFDLYGWYDTDRLCFDRFGKNPIPPDKLQVIVNEIIKRNKFTIISGDITLSLPMPRAFKQHLWYLKSHIITKDYGKCKSGIQSACYDSQKAVPKIKRRLICPQILRLVSDCLQARFLSDYQREFKQFCSARNLAEDSSNALVAFDLYRESCKNSPQVVHAEVDFKARYFSNEKDYQ